MVVLAFIRQERMAFYQSGVGCNAQDWTTALIIMTGGKEGYVKELIII
ncbi:MAG: hypothetical protein LBK69_03945 [Syntrophomonadaceae bacterium]|jgi:hypothetical protein|nr:hypothetical protein [Syntrophomonadaceae bacterium]